MVEETDGLRNAGFDDDEGQSPFRFLESGHSSDRVFINEKMRKK